MQYSLAEAERSISLRSEGACYLFEKYVIVRKGCKCNVGFRLFLLVSKVLKEPILLYFCASNSQINLEYFLHSFIFSRSLFLDNFFFFAGFFFVSLFLSLAPFFCILLFLYLTRSLFLACLSSIYSI